MEQWRANLQVFVKNRLYMLMLSLTAACSYGFLITHQTVGIDDTPYAYYFEEGLAAIVGRWVLFLVNRIFHISDFSPFITDLAGVLILMAAVTVWCSLLYSILRERVPMWGYMFFSCIFLSCPLISEVYTYYLHNGISIGYLCAGISLCFYREMLERRSDRRQALLCGAGTAVFLWIALGCYESFMIVWLLGVLLVLLTERYAGIRRKVFWALCAGAVVAAVAIILRGIMSAAVVAVFRLGDMRGEAVHRSVTEMLSWIFKPEASAGFHMALKRVFIMYGVFAYAYYPILIFVLAAVVMVLCGLCRAVMKRDVWSLLLTIGCFLASFLLVIVEGSVTLYRSAQFLPVICAYGAFLTAYIVSGLREPGLFDGSSQEGKTERGRAERGKAGRLVCRVCRGLTVSALCAVLWNQCFDMNRWFYIDYLKYEYAKEVIREVAYELEKNYDTAKPVAFTGTYLTPRSIIGDAYVEFNTDTFYAMRRLAGMVDEQLLEKYDREYGVWVVQTPSLSVIEWGRSAFGDDSELIRFFAMHGYELNALTDAEVYAAAEEYSVNLPHFPAEGSVVDMGEYIIVHF